MPRRNFRLLAASAGSTAPLLVIWLLAVGIFCRRLRLKLRTRRGGMIQMNNAPCTIAPVAESGSSRNRHMLSHHNFEIIFHPRGIADKMVRAWNGGKLRRRSLLEIGLAVIVEVCRASIEITGGRGSYNVRIKTFAEGVLIGPVKSVFALGELLVQFQQRGF